MRFIVRYATRIEDLNVAGHLDNLRILRAVDEARNTFLGMPGAGLPGAFDGFGAQVAPFVAAHRVEYRAELGYAAEPLEVTLWVCRVGRTSLEVAAEVRQAPGEPVAVVASTSVVLLTFGAGPHDRPCPWVVTDAAREALAAYQHDPLVFR
jgi:acyl-CoA thioester hydrolase